MAGSPFTTHNTLFLNLAYYLPTLEDLYEQQELRIRDNAKTRTKMDGIWLSEIVKG